MSEDLLEIKCRAMLKNLLFFGIVEAPKGENDNSEMKLRDFLENRTLRTGQNTSNQIR